MPKRLPKSSANVAFHWKSRMGRIFLTTQKNWLKWSPFRYGLSSKFLYFHFLEVTFCHFTWHNATLFVSLIFHFQQDVFVENIFLSLSMYRWMSTIVQCICLGKYLVHVFSHYFFIISFYLWLCIVQWLNGRLFTSGIGGCGFPAS